MGYNGIPEYGQSMSDMFTDVKNRVINFEFFREYFDQVSLPMNLAQACVGDMFHPRPRRAAHKEFVKFIKLSTLRQHPRLPRFQDVRRELVDYREIEAFALQGALSVWGGDDVFSDSPCVFASHRWQSPTHPDPDGAQKATIVDRLNKVDLKFRGFGGSREEFRGFGGSREDKRSRTANARPTQRGVSGGSAPGAE